MDNIRNNMRNWFTNNYLNLSIFNIFLLGLFLLRSAGYFHPFFVISVNFIVMAGLVASIFILGARSKVIFIVGLLFWIFASFLRVMKVDIWAERTAIYTFEALVIGMVAFILEKFKRNN